MLKVGQCFMSKSGTMYIIVCAHKPNLYTRDPSSYGLVNLDTGIGTMYLNDVFPKIQAEINRLDLVPMNVVKPRQ